MGYGFPPIGVIKIPMYHLHGSRCINEEGMYLPFFFLPQSLVESFFQLLDFLTELDEIIMGRLVQHPICPCPIEFQVAFANNAFRFFLHLEHADAFTMQFQKGSGIKPFSFLVLSIGLGNQTFQFQQYVLSFFEGHGIMGNHWYSRLKLQNFIIEGIIFITKYKVFLLEATFM